MGGFSTLVSNEFSNNPTPFIAVSHETSFEEAHYCNSGDFEMSEKGPSETVVIGEQKYAFQKVVLFKNEIIGSGSYGAVCKAKCDQLICAAKLLYPVLFQMRVERPDPSKEHRQALRRFEQECQFLSQISHPNIVQYMGTYHDSDTNAPVLLMELMDESLTHFLESSPGDIPYHIQVNLSQDIAQALAFLHANGIIHRDLSSNNVLLIASSRAKVSDFGMFKFADFSASRLATMTQCPGTPAFMSPEALDDPPVYTEKLDIFSFGVLLVQIVTTKFPTPTKRFEIQRISAPQSSKRMVEAKIPIPEVDRRMNHIIRIDPNHPLLLTALACLKDQAVERPSSQQLCRSLDGIKETSKYKESSPIDLSSLIEAKNKEIKEMTQLVQIKDKTVEANLKEYVSIKEKVEQLETTLHLSDQKNEALKEKRQSLQDKIKNQELELEKLLRKSGNQSTLSSDLQQQSRDLVNDDNTSASSQSSKMPDKYESNHFSRRSSKPYLHAICMRWETLDFSSNNLYAGSSAVIGNVAYFTAGVKTIHKFSFVESKWSELPDCTFTDYTIVAVDDVLTTVGGTADNWRGIPKYSNKLFCYFNKKWVESFPPMPTCCSSPGAVYLNNNLVVIGGYNLTNGTLSTVEILDTACKQWSMVGSLPFKTSQPSVTICGEFLYLHAGYTPSEHEAKSVLKCFLPELFSFSSSSVWKRIASLNFSKSSFVTANGHLFAVGGESSEGGCTQIVHQYKADYDYWITAGCMSNARCKCLTAFLPGNRLLAVGGDSDEEMKIEVATFESS